MKNNIRKIISLLLCVLTLLTAFPAYASSIGSVATDPSIGEDTAQGAKTTYAEKGIGTSDTDVYLTIDNSNVLVYVPTSVIINGEPTDDGKYIGEYSVKVKGDISGSQKLCVGPNAKNVELTQDGKPSTKAEMHQDKLYFNSDEVANGTTTKGTATAEALTAGSWNASTNFLITIIDYVNKVEIPSESEATYLYVSPSGNNETGDGTKDNPYASLWYANNTIKDNSVNNKYVIKVEDGVYNDLESIYTDNYTEGNYWGIIAKDYVYYLGNSEHPENVQINWDAAKGFDNLSLLEENVSKTEIFHIFASTETSINGFSLNATNTLRTLHIEKTGTGNNKTGNYSIENCNITFNGDIDIPNQYGDVIGCGSNDGEFGYFYNCNITTYNTAYPARLYSVHTNDTNNSSKDGAKIIFENCAFNAPSFYGDNRPLVSTGVGAGNTDSLANIYLLNCTGNNGDGECGIYIKNFPQEYNISAWCDSNPIDYNNATFFNDYTHIKYGIENYLGKDAIAVTHIYVKPNTQYKIEVNDGYTIQYVRHYKQYLYGKTPYAAAKIYNSQSVNIDTTNEYGNVTGIDVIVKRNDGSPATQNDLSQVKLRIVEV